jgi:antitoxin FitA
MMSSITIRNLDDGLKRRLRLRAAQRNHSMEEEARDILRRTLTEEADQQGNLADRIRGRVDALGGGVELDIPPRGPMREPPDLA